MYRYARTHSRGRTLSLCLSLSLMAAHEEDEFIVVRSERGKVNIWRHFGFKKRKTDNTLSLYLSLLSICPWQRNKEPSKPGVEVKLLTVAIDIRRERESKSLQHCVLRYTSAKYQFWGEILVKIPSPSDDVHVRMVGITVRKCRCAANTLVMCETSVWKSVLELDRHSLFVSLLI